MTTREEYKRTLALLFWYVNRYLMVPMWRLGLGRLINFWPEGVGQIMVIVHRGRRSGQMYHTPVNYVLINGDVYCMAGFGTKSDWYRNIMANPQVEVWLPDGWWAGVAEDVSNCENRLSIVRQLLIASGFAAPLFEGVDPRTITDAEIERIAAGYPLIRVRRTEARTGPGGPGELAWVWPLATIGLALLLMLRPRRRR